MTVIIRNVVASDWSEIQKLNNEVFQNDRDNDTDLKLDWPFSDIGIKYYKDLANGKYGHCFVAEVNEVIVGYIALAKKQFHYRKSTYVEIENMGVTKEYRSQGVGKQLISKAKEWSEEQGIQKIIVEAFWHNTSAIDFYKQNGFLESSLELVQDL